MKSIFADVAILGRGVIRGREKTNLASITLGGERFTSANPPTHSLPARGIDVRDPIRFDCSKITILLELLAILSFYLWLIDTHSDA